MAFDVTEKMLLAGIVKETYETIGTQLVQMALDADQETYIRDLMDIFEAIKFSHVKLSGGSDGVNFDNDRKREAIRQELRKALGLSLISWEVSGGYSQSVPHVVNW